MNGSHPEMLDDVAVYALGSLPAADAARVRAHIESCAECRAEYEALAPAVAAVGRSAEACTNAASGAVHASPLLKARIMRDVRAQATKPASPARTSSRAVWAAYALAAACVIIALSLGAANLSLRHQVSSLETAHVPPHGTNVNERTLADLVDEKAKRYAVPGGEIIRAHDRLYIAMHDMPAPPRGKVYQAWTLPKGSKTMVPNATFVPDRRGVAILALGVDAKTTHAVAVSVEPAGGSKAPTSSPVVLELLE